ncbi:MAG TPA: PIN domain-containing protein [Caulobacteraceae bacterium]
MTLCLDTNVIVDILNGKRPEVRQRYQGALANNQHIVVSSLTVHELVFGALISRRPEHHVGEVRALLAQLDAIDWSERDAYAAARIRARLRRAGHPIGDIDALIAGQAVECGWTLVTANVREFSRIEDLDLEDWSSG